MTTSNGNFPPERLTKIDKLNHPKYLNDNDKCYYLGEYTIGGGFKESETNQLITNYKMEMSIKAKNPMRWRHKRPAIIEVAKSFWLTSPKKVRKFWANSILVPLPPSKIKDHDDYDDRNFQMLKILKAGVKGGKGKQGIKLTVKELVVQKQSRTSMHDSDQRPSVKEIQDNYILNSKIVLAKPPKSIALFDDTLINGTTFKAAKNLLQAEYPDCDIRGFFIARGNHKVDEDLEKFKASLNKKKDQP